MCADGKPRRRKSLTPLKPDLLDDLLRHLARSGDPRIARWAKKLRAGDRANFVVKTSQ